TYLLDRTNHSNRTVDFATREIIFNMLAESIFKDFTQGEFAGYKRGVRLNLDQHLVDLFAFHHLNENRESIIDQKFITRYSSFGMASITVPSDRIEQACAYKLAADVVDHWGSLSHAEFNAAVLTDVVLADLLPAIRLYEGNFAADGKIVQRHDLQNALRDDGRKLGQRIDNLIVETVRQTAREVSEGVHQQKGNGLAQYLRAAVEREMSKLRNDKQDPQQWGDYSRAVHFNKEQIVESSQKLLRQEVARIINEEHQSVGYAIAVLRQATNVLRDENREYIPAFQRGVDQAVKTGEDAKRRLDHLLAATGRHEARSNWDGRKKTIIQYDVTLFEETAPQYLNAILAWQVRAAAKEICERLISYIGLADPTESGEVRTEGLIGELYTLGGQLENLKRRLVTKYEHFRQKTASELSLMLYDPADIENNYLQRYLGSGEEARKKIESVGDQILQELQTSVIELPRLVRQRGIDSIELQISDLARKPFANIKKDFDVLETLWRKYPGESEREAQVRFIFNKAKFWLHGGSRARSYVLSAERHKILVGIPQDSADPIKLAEFETMLKTKIPEPGDPALSIQRIPERSEIVFYSEVGGIPINWADSVAEHRIRYFQKQGEGEELHTDAHEIKFDDLLVLDDRERAEMEEAHECFLLGLIFGEIKPEKDAAARIRYVYSEEIGLVGSAKMVALGIEMRAIAELISKRATRSKLLAKCRDHLDRVRRSVEGLAQYNALLGWYFREVYPETRITGSDGAEHCEQSNMCRAVYKQIQAIEQFLESRQESNGKSRQNGGDSTQEFMELSRAYGRKLDSFVEKLIDGKRALKPAAGQAAAPPRPSTQASHQRSRRGGA
ncbi:MAG TPA: tubulin-like doman-containing protein, partial [Blastocatellia bacterium]|nr:tubulin-like doman-containing protein [Blastocatellia bacterium]